MIEFWAKAQGDKLAVDDGSEKLTYRELAHRASLYRTAARALFSARSSAEALAVVVGLLTTPSTVALIDSLSVSEDFAFQLDKIPVAYVVKRGEVTGDELLSFVNSKVAFYKKQRCISWRSCHDI